MPNCIWCNSPTDAKNKGKMFCNKQYCHMSFHYHRTKYYQPLSPTEFKNYILELMELEQHPNPHHPIHDLKEGIAGIKTNATELKNELNERKAI